MSSFWQTNRPVDGQPRPGTRTKKPSLRRFTWCRFHHDLLQQDLWSLVAVMAGSELAIVEAFVARLEICASSSVPRGSVLEFNVPALAAKWRREPAELARIFAALEDPAVGWIDQDCIASFWLRNPDQEDATAAERQKRRRARLKLEAAERRAMKEGGVVHSHGVTHRDSVTVTTISEQRKERGSGSVDSSGISAGAKGAAPQQAVQRDGADLTPQESADLWLATDGKRIVVERMQDTGPRAQVRLDRWLKDVAGDAADLQAIISAADRTDLVGARFHNTVVDQIRRSQHQSKGPPLPLPPAGLKRTNHG